MHSLDAYMSWCVYMCMKHVLMCTLFFMAMQCVCFYLLITQDHAWVYVSGWTYMCAHLCHGSVLKHAHMFQKTYAQLVHCIGTYQCEGKLTAINSALTKGE